MRKLINRYVFDYWELVIFYWWEIFSSNRCNPSQTIDHARPYKQITCVAFRSLGSIGRKRAARGGILIIVSFDETKAENYF